jgi:hypothetical protein
MRHTTELDEEYERRGLIRPGEAGRRLGVDRDALDYLVKIGDLPVHTFPWRNTRLMRGFHPDDLDRDVTYRNGRPRLSP